MLCRFVLDLPLRTNAQVLSHVTGCTASNKCRVIFESIFWKKDSPNPLFGVHGVQPSSCVPSAYSTIDSHSNKSLKASVDIRLSFSPNYPFNGLSRHPFFFLHQSPSISPYSMEKEGMSQTAFSLPSLFFMFRKHEETRLLEGMNLLDECVCSKQAAPWWYIEGSLGLCKKKKRS